MPTESFYQALSTDPVYNNGYEGERVARNFASPTQYALCAEIRDALLAAGWQNAGGTKASFSLVLPFGLPTASPPDIEIEDPPTVYGGPNPITINGDRITFYDPFRVLPAEVPGVVWVAMGITSDETIANLVEVVEGYGWVFIGSHNDPAYPFYGWLHVDFEAAGAGLEANSEAYGGEGAVYASAPNNWYWGFLSSVGVAGGPFGNAPAGGGVYLRSQQTATDYLDVWIGIPATGGARATFRFIAASQEDGVQPSWQLLHGAQFRIVANQFQFFAWDAAGANQLFCIFPKFATFRGTTYAAVCGQDFRTTLLWPNAYSAANGGLHRSGHFIGACPNVYTFKTPGVPVKDFAGRAVAQTAFISASPYSAEDGIARQARIAGLVWDAIAVSSDEFALGAQVRHGALNYECVAIHNGDAWGSHASLWVAFEQPGA